MTNMNVTLKRIDQSFHFEGFGESNIAINIDGSKKIGGNDLGARPMELVLMALGSCASMDLISILKKQRQELKNLQIKIKGERDYSVTPAVFKKIDIHFILSGNLINGKVEKAIRLSMEKYCSVSEMLKSSVDIIYSFQIKGEKNGNF